MTTPQKINVKDGLLFYLISKIRPELANKIAEKNEVETAIVGLGRQGVRHAGIMKDFGTCISAGIAPGKGGQKIHETIPVYDSVKDCLQEHPDIAAVSIWRHYSMAKEAALEVIESGIPFVVLITEGIPLKDVRHILTAARRHNTLLLGGNTPGVIFPPEGIKIGMLPDVFYPEEIRENVFGPHGVTIISRSGAILYHMSDALASVGVAQNAVLGIGGDGAIGTPFKDIVPLVMGHKNTDLVVIAGEIGGCAEEMLAQRKKEHPELFPKKIVALISGANAPEGKTMGHAGAIVAPGQEYGTFQAKKKALEEVGIPVANSQLDLISLVKKALNGKKYFQAERYYQKMKKMWEAKPPEPTWGTLITRVAPNDLVIRGYPLKNLVADESLMSVVHLLIEGKLPAQEKQTEMESLFIESLKYEIPDIEIFDQEDISQTLSRFLLTDPQLIEFNPQTENGALNKTVLCLARTAAFLGKLNGIKEVETEVLGGRLAFNEIIYRLLTGKQTTDIRNARLFESMIVASVDHGVTPPSAQAAVIAASVRASYETAIAHGVGAITDVHGGAGAKAALFFKNAVEKSRTEGLTLKNAVKKQITKAADSGKRIEGMGHRIHTQDPRRDVIWSMAEKAGVDGPAIKISKMIGELFDQIRGLNLPINVDGVIGAVVSDMNLDPRLAKIIFIYGRIAGLSAHYYEEITTQPPMRRINFAQAVYKGKENS